VEPGEGPLGVRRARAWGRAALRADGSSVPCLAGAGGLGCAREGALARGHQPVRPREGRRGRARGRGPADPLPGGEQSPGAEPQPLPVPLLRGDMRLSPVRTDRARAGPRALRLSLGRQRRSRVGRAGAQQESAAPRAALEPTLAKDTLEAPPHCGPSSPAAAWGDNAATGPFAACFSLCQKQVLLSHSVSVSCMGGGSGRAVEGQ